jgi:hypothetical protein
MPQSLNFHPEWGCLAPAPSLLRTMRIVLVATAVGVVAGGGVVLSLGAHSEKSQMSVAQRTLVEPLPIVPTAINAPQSNPEKIGHSESKEVWLRESQLNDSPTNEVNASSPARSLVVTASTKVRTSADGTSAKTGVVPSPTIRIRAKHLAQGPRHKENASSSRPPQHSLVSQTDSNVFQRLWSGLTAAIEHVWAPST